MASNTTAFLLAALCPLLASAGGVTGKTYSNFGADLVNPVFPNGGVLAVYAKKGDVKPRETIQGAVFQLDGDPKRCLRAQKEDWGYCNLEGTTGWVKRADFRSAAEFAPVKQWPFRYWMYIALQTSGGEETSALLAAVPKVPYLVLPKEYENVLFHVRFDTEGNAISPRDGKLTGDRVYVVNNAVYLAPADPAKRERATWLFLNYYNEKLQALCPGESPESCMSAVNLAPGWKGITAMYTKPAAQFSHKETDGRWFGPGEVAFARHADPVQPLMYRVPDDVRMRADRSDASDAERAKNRAKPFCIADCAGQ